MIGFLLLALAHGALADMPLEAWSGKKSAASDNRLFAMTATLNGKGHFRLGLDTAVDYAVITESAAEEASISSGASVSFDWAGGKVNGKWFQAAKIAAGDFVGVLGPGLIIADADMEKMCNLDGFVGLKFLSSYMWTVDPFKTSLSLVPRDSPLPDRPGTKIGFSVDPKRGIVLKGSIGGKSCELIASTGLGDVFFDKDMAHKLGLNAIGPVQANGATKYQVGPSVALELDGLKTGNLQVFISQRPGWQNLGQSFFNRYIATWDMKNQQVLLSIP